MNTPRNIRPSLTEVERSPIQQALDNYTQMEHMLRLEREKNRDLSIQNTSLMSEVNMYKEQWEVADQDRIRLQAVSSTLTGELMAINAVIGDAVRRAIKNGVEATETAKTPEQRTEDETLEKAAGEAQEIIRRVEPAYPIHPHEASPALAQSRLGLVDWIHPRG